MRDLSTRALHGAAAQTFTLHDLPMGVPQWLT